MHFIYIAYLQFTHIVHIDAGQLADPMGYTVGDVLIDLATAPHIFTAKTICVVLFHVQHQLETWLEG